MGYADLSLKNNPLKIMFSRNYLPPLAAIATHAISLLHLPHSLETELIALSCAHHRLHYTPKNPSPQILTAP